jgi:hypothetical protein
VCQACHCPDLASEEIRGSEDVPTGLQEFFPGRPLLPLWGRFDTVLPKDIRDRSAADLMVDVGEGALNPGVAPLAILGRHPHHL